MAIPVLIIGRSGTGKSTSLRNCVDNPDWNLIRVLNKPLPFKGKINGWNTDNYQQVMKCLIASKANNIVIDDAGYLITNMFMNRTQLSRWWKWSVHPVQPDWGSLLESDPVYFRESSRKQNRVCDDA